MQGGEQQQQQKQQQEEPVITATINTIASLRAQLMAEMDYLRSASMNGSWKMNAISKMLAREQKFLLGLRATPK